MLDLPAQTVIRVIDTETTGIDDNAVIVEIGYCDLTAHGGGEWSVGRPTGALINSGRAIPPEATAVHHIRNIDIATAGSGDRVFASMHSEKVTHYAAHNAAFDRRFFGGGSLPWICSLKAAYRCVPGSPSHGNQTLRYLLEIDDLPDFSPELASPPHRAAADTYVTAFILRFFLENGVKIEDMISWCDKPSILPRLRFGKHAGTPWEEIPIDYLEWLTRQRDLDTDAKHTARHWIKKRKN